MTRTGEYKMLEPEQLKLSDTLRRQSRNCTIASWSEREGERCSSATTTGEQGIGAFASKYQPSRSKARTTSAENGLEFVAVGLDDFGVLR